jgi:predicted RNA-binding Zn-ribbon protein involved in translation (DUF1610 family)
MFGTAKVTLSCPECDFSAQLDRDDTDWTCPNCQRLFSFQMCTHCRKAVQIEGQRSGKWDCPWCGKKNNAQGQSVYATAEEVVEALQATGVEGHADESPPPTTEVTSQARVSTQADGWPTQSTVPINLGRLNTGTRCVFDCVLIGTSELTPRLQSVCTILFGLNEIFVEPAQFDSDLQFLYADIASLELSGPGEVKSGGGFIGGGFGVKGAAKGILAASVLNWLTTRTTVQTVIRLATHTSEYIFSTDKASPQELRLDLSPVFMRISAAQRRAITVRQAELIEHPSPSLPHEVRFDLVGQLKALAELRAAGVLTDEEFGLAKAKILRDMW